MASRSALPPKLVRRRIDVHVGDFFRWFDGYYAKRGWVFGPFECPDPADPLGSWVSRDVTVQITHTDTDDGDRPLELEVSLRNIPGVLRRDDQDHPVIGREHAFAVVLPEGYPTDLRMRLVNLTETVHPRMMPPDKGAPACIFPNSELDLVLRELFFNVLLKPDVVRPPILFDKADHGYRPREMKWYSEYGPQRLFDELCTQMDEWQRELAGEPGIPAKPAPDAGFTGGFRIRESDDSADAPPPPFQIHD